MTDREWSLQEWDDWWQKTGERPDEEKIDSEHHHHEDAEEDDPYAPAVNKMLMKHRRLCFGEGESKRIFLTFCGNSLDLKWLSEEGQEVIGNDYSTFALEGFMQEHKLEYDVSTADEFQVYKAKSTNLALYAGNFFKLTPDLCGGQVDAIWDTGSFQSAAIADRKTYAKSVAALMKPCSNYLLSVVNFKDLRTWKGPPYTITDEIIEETFGDIMTWKQIDSAPWADYVERIVLLQLKQ
uniref:Thiopurine S-methyltransferase-like n=1 Tax=Phallusia mammillata TaxID=59560 RepID=A0A6F9DW12_9ASCI|nr:thiopurine S-methyltransferase-like [Phallusia mammillata]